MRKLLVICGPTATGKTSLGVKLAKKFNGEIVSTDSRQVYQGMDIGTGKDLPSSSQFVDRSSQLGFENQKIKIGFRIKNRVPVWLVDICKPNYIFNVGEYKKLAYLVIADIWNRGKLPIVVGGTGLYIRSLVEPLDKMSIPPNNKLRKELDKLNVTQLQERLQRVDQGKFETMNQSDRQNPRRLIRAIEIAAFMAHGEDSPQLFKQLTHTTLGKHAHEDVLLIGLTTLRQELYRRIDERVDERVNQGIIKEIEMLLRKKYDWKLPSMSGLGYREWRDYFEKSNTKNQISNKQREELITNIIQQWKYDEHAYARRQLTWFKKMAGIQWFDITLPNCQTRVVTAVRQWYNSVNH